MSKNTRNRILLTAVAALLLVTLTIGGTMAWLKAETTSIENTFTPATLSVNLTETGVEDNKNSFQMIPGATIDKDPKVTYETDVDAYLFVEVTESANLDAFISYSVITGTNAWTLVPNETNVYYMEVGANTKNETGINVIQTVDGNSANKVTVKNTVDKDMMDALINGTATNPTLTFQAYIIQKDATSINTPEAAWALAK